MSAYTVFFRGEQVMRFHMDATEASAAIELEDELGEIEPTVFQTADAGHDPEVAADLLNEWLEAQGGAAWPVGRRVEIERDEEEEGDEE